MRSSWIEVDLDALKKNTEQIKSLLAPDVKLLVPLKGNAYGHGAEECARVFRELGASYFGVAIPEEGVQLREAGYDEPILVFGYTFADSYDLLFHYDLMPNVFTLAQAEELSAMAAARETVLPVHISVDTGLHRLGLPLEDAFEVIVKIAALPGIRVEGIFTMHATSGYADPTYANVQFSRFMNLCSRLEQAGISIPLRHICDSGATMLYPEMHLDMVRPGSILYGTPATDEPVPGFTIYPVMSVHSRLASIRYIAAGEYVGYEQTWQAARPSIIGVVPCGFVDGVSRQASNKGFVLLHGKRCPIVGNVCMDQFMIDITDVDAPAIGDEIVLAGRQGDEEISLAEAGGYAGTSDTEFICRLNARLPLRYIENGQCVR